MNAQEFKHKRKSLRLGQRECGKIVGLSEEEIRDIEREAIPLTNPVVRALEYYADTRAIKELINVIKARRWEAKVGLIEFCDSMGILYEEWKKLEDF